MVSKIDELTNLEVVGNAAGDKSLFDLAHSILMDESESLENKIAALKKIDDAMGLNYEITHWDVTEYINSFADEED